MAGSVNLPRLAVLALFALAAAYGLFFKCKYVLTLVLCVLTAAAFSARETLLAIVKTASRDLKGIRTLITMQFLLRRHMKARSTTASIFSELVKRQPDKVGIIVAESGKEWRYLEVEECANQIANYLASVGFGEGEIVALFMQNCPEYLWTWLGVSKIGVVTALLNNNLRLEPLAHSIRIAKSKAIICSTELSSALFEAITAGLVERVPVYVYGAFQAENVPTGLVVKNLRTALESVSKVAPMVKLQNVDFKSTLFYIYTSGTTGLPKAAIISHARFFMMAKGVNVAFNLKPSDRVYVTMPMYHSAAGILGTGQLLLGGASIVIKTKFSASHFWEECIRYQCTASQYIGEICRYLLAQPHKGTDSEHSVRLMFGNGLRPAIWEDFTCRFRIAQIGEFYGSTEGNNNLLNMDNTVGACGFLPIWTGRSSSYPVTIVKIDEATGEHLRDENGLCVRCKPGETGEIVGRIIKGDALKDFKGYVSDNDTSKKIIYDVFFKGDAAFSSGDILHMDKQGYLYFRDRVGDTFRWKGENVSTCEVEAALIKAIGKKETTVYGVEVEGCEGRAGMAAIVCRAALPAADLNLAELATALKASLPIYARPVFLRLCNEAVDQTGTYKLKKTELQKAGYDPARCGKDALFYFNSKKDQFEELTPSMYADLAKGLVRF